MKTDTNSEIEKILLARYMAMSGSRRVEICTGMYETAKALIYASFPEDATNEWKKKEFFKRMHGFELPDRE
jgi:hypothetical protein